MTQKNTKPVIVPRLHEQREHYKKKTLVIDKLRRRMLFEVIDWCKKTERVDIHRRFILQSYDWNKKRDDKYDYLTLNLKEIDIKKENIAKKEIIDKIMSEHFDTLKYSLVEEIIRGLKKHEEQGGAISINEIEKKLKAKKDDGNFKYESSGILW